MKKSINLTLQIWRQENAADKGGFVTYKVQDVSTEMSFLEMIDVLNDDLTKRGEIPVEFDNDCREGICGMCGMVIDGTPHGPQRGATLCQLHMRLFNDGDTIIIEPWRAKAFPVIKDLMVDRSALDRIQMEGGYITIRTGSAPEANSIPIAKETADAAMDAAACIGCGACVAACPNASATLFVSAKIAQLALLPQGNMERARRVDAMMAKMDEEGFGACTNVGECEAVCPKEISIVNIARMKREYWRAMVRD
jgi:succinate dehydrogenase / fumarate reductase iron-sulfur subunit